jgi:glycosyltransferase involved in cell wall biosynthesis
MVILYQGLLRSPASWARVGRGYLRELLRLGVDVSALSVRGFRHDRRFPLPEGLRELSLDEARAGPEPSHGLGFLHPTLLDRLRGLKKVNLFVWESDVLPPGWASALERGADLVVAPSSFTREALVSSGLAGANVAVVPYGYEPDFLDRARRGAPHASRRLFTFFSVMSPHWRKGIRELFTAYRRRFTKRDEVLLRVKSTYDPLSCRRRQRFEIPSWREALEQAGLAEPAAPRVEIDLRTLDDESAMALYLEADVYVQPSWGESFGLSLLEGMASGLPAIATGWGGHLDFFPSREDLVSYRLAEVTEGLYQSAPGARVALPDVDALAERLRWHWEHRDESRALGALAKSTVVSLTWPSGAKKLLEAIQ